jgi:hypothetical protein
VERKFQLNKAALSKRTGMIYTLNKVGLFLDTHHLTYLRDDFLYSRAKKRLLFSFSIDSRYITSQVKPAKRSFNFESLMMEYATQPGATLEFFIHVDTSASSILLSALAPLFKGRQ